MTHPKTEPICHLPISVFALIGGEISHQCFLCTPPPNYIMFWFAQQQLGLHSPVVIYPTVPKSQCSALYTIIRKENKKILIMQ